MTYLHWPKSFSIVSYRENADAEKGRPVLKTHRRNKWLVLSNTWKWRVKCAAPNLLQNPVISRENHKQKEQGKWRADKNGQDYSISAGMSAPNNVLNDEIRDTGVQPKLPWMEWDNEQHFHID